MGNKLITAAILLCLVSPALAGEYDGAISDLKELEREGYTVVVTETEDNVIISIEEKGEDDAENAEEILRNPHK